MVDFRNRLTLIRLLQNKRNLASVKFDVFMEIASSAKGNHKWKIPVLNSLNYSKQLSAEYAIISQFFIKSEYFYVDVRRIKATAGAEQNMSASVPINIRRINFTSRF